MLALSVLRRVHRGAFAAPVLSEALDRSDLVGADRSLVTDLVYGTLRHQLGLDASLAPHLRRPDKLPPDVRDALRIGSYEILHRDTPRRAAVNEWVEIVKRQTKGLAGLVNAVLRKVETPEPLAPHLRYGVPAWLYAEWEALFGQERAPDVAAGMAEPEPLWLTSYHPQASHTLIQEGCEVRLGPVEHTLAVRAPKPLQQLDTYQKGWVQPQNPTSTLPVRLLEPLPHDRVLDLASGNGIKAAQLASLGARPLSVDIDQNKLGRAARNLARLGFEADSLAHDLRTPPNVPPSDKILLDAPCTGTGTLRGNPEIRLRVTPEGRDELVALQRQLLTTAAELTAPDGLLVYAVCALTEAEGIGMVSWFLAAHPEFHAEPFILDLPTHTAPQGSYILPLGGLDGFFIARLRRES
ncbi:MAG: transcription antitermination factor NusB [Trueperaceae bacterium]|nr:transcription antitermination factor NusB [Trueperaceae bacterium]